MAQGDPQSTDFRVRRTAGMVLRVWLAVLGGSIVVLASGVLLLVLPIIFDTWADGGATPGEALSFLHANRIWLAVAVLVVGGLGEAALFTLKNRSVGFAVFALMFAGPLAIGLIVLVGAWSMYVRLLEAAG